jgi:hypothetical protein
MREEETIPGSLSQPQPVDADVANVGIRKTLLCLRRCWNEFKYWREKGHVGVPDGTNQYHKQKTSNRGEGSSDIAMLSLIAAVFSSRISPSRHTTSSAVQYSTIRLLGSVLHFDIVQSDDYQ